MSSWEDWNKHVLKCRGASAGGIFTHKGAVCAQQGTVVGADQILNLNSCYDGTSNSIVLGEAKFMLLKNENDILFFRSGSIPASVTRTQGLYLVAIGFEDASSSNLAADLEKVSRQLKFAGL